MDQLLIKRKNRIRINICQDLGKNVKVTYLVRLEIGAQRWHRMLLIITKI
jgi:hypothetical protein